MKKLSLLVVLLVLVLAGAYFAFPKKADDAFVIRAQDGAAELRIPKDAVLEGGAIKDITITAIAPTDFFKESNQPTASVKIYRLEPDGLTFSKPATISITLPYDKNKAYSPIFLTYSGEEKEVEILDVADFRPDEERGTYIVSGALSHFSDLLLIDRYIFDAQHIPKENITATIGQSFNITHVITPRKYEQLSKIVIDSDTGEARYQVTTRDMENEYRPEERNFTIVTIEIRNGTRWELWENSSTIYTNGVVEPIKVILEAADLGATEEYRITTRFTCVKLGYDKVFFRATPIYDPQPTITYVKGGKLGEPVMMYGGGGKVGLVELRGPEISCVAPPSGQDSPSTDVRSETPPSAVSPTQTVPQTSGGVIKVCGLPGGPACPKK